jgi:bifunctional non-homologous end joining protein LigD
MTLDMYRKKRNFTQTLEPKGKVAHSKKSIYVIQKHAASHLHYDFRLELNGTLKSWAVPKGPCLDPSVKRLAVHVEDHPLQYASFEGIIPKGQYGGGTVMLWDKGEWISLDDNPEQAYKKGHLRFELHAEKLRGRWDLIRFQDNKNWFLIKGQDKFSKKLDDFDILEKKPDSVVSHRTLSQIAAGSQDIDLNLQDLSKNPFPETVFPQLATLVDKPPDTKNWIHEVK